MIIVFSLCEIQVEHGNVYVEINNLSWLPKMEVLLLLLLFLILQLSVYSKSLV